MRNTPPVAPSWGWEGSGTHGLLAGQGHLHQGAAQRPGRRPGQAWPRTLVCILGAHTQAASSSAGQLPFPEPLLTGWVLSTPWSADGSESEVTSPRRPACELWGLDSNLAPSDAAGPRRAADVTDVPSGSRPDPLHTSWRKLRPGTSYMLPHQPPAWLRAPWGRRRAVGAQQRGSGMARAWRWPPRGPRAWPSHLCGPHRARPHAHRLPGQRPHLPCLDPGHPPGP